jgi:hypothetical protein
VFINVTTDQIPEDPGIRDWTEARSERAEPGVCGLIAPELMHDALVGYPEGALWSRPVAQSLFTKPEPIYHVAVAMQHGAMG